MANQEIDILVKLKDEASAELKKLQAHTSSFKDGLNKVGIASTAALVGISAFAKGAIDAAIDQQRANTQLEAVLKSTKWAVGLTSEAIQDLANNLQLTTGIEDDVIQSAQNMLLTFTNIGKDVFPNATAMTLDMATAMNWGLAPSAEQLSNQAIQLGKALNDPIMGMGALRKVGVAFTEAQKEQITTLQQSGDIMGAQKIILAELSTEFGWSATAQTKTFAGQMGLVNIQLKDAYEAIGTALIPVLQDLMKTVTPYLLMLTEWIKKNPELTKDIILVSLALATLGASVLVLWPIVTGLTAIFSALGVVLTFLAANPVVLIIAAFVAVGVAVYNIWKNWDTIKPKLLAFWEDIKMVVTFTINELLGYFQTTFPALTSVVRTEWEIIKGIIDMAMAGVNKVRELVNTAKAVAWRLSEDFTLQSALNLNADFSQKIDGARAEGGPVRGGWSYLVGENGPEIFTPRSSGNIIPNGWWMGTININFGNVSVRGQNDIDSLANQVGEVLMRQMQLYKQGIS